jgi:hypothetical protein
MGRRYPPPIRVCLNDRRVTARPHKMPGRSFGRAPNLEKPWRAPQKKPLSTKTAESQIKFPFRMSNLKNLRSK